MPYEFVEHQTRADTHASEKRLITATVKKNGMDVVIEGEGNGPIDAYVNALKKDSGKDIKVFSYSEHSVGGGSDASAIAFVETEVDGKHLYGIGQDPNIVSASLIAVTCAVNRAIRNGDGR
jgi:2-isopropylmalate synthase